MTKRAIWLTLFFVFLTFLITFPTVLTITSKVIGDGGDSYQFLSFQYIAKRLFEQGDFPFGWTNFWRYPYGIEFQNIYDSSLFIMLGVSLYQFITNPVLVYNLSVYIFIFLGLVLAYNSFRFFFKPLVSLIGAVIYSLSFYSIARLGGHMNLYLISSMPFFAYSLLFLHKEKGSSKSFVVFTIATLLVPFTSLQYPLFVLGALPFVLLLTFIFFRKELFEFIQVLYKKRVNLIFSLSTILLFFYIFHGQKAIDLVSGKVPMPINEISTIKLINFFTPNVYLQTLATTVSNNTPIWIENAVFFGYAELILFIAAVFVLKKNKYFKFLLLGFLLFFFIALGKQDYLSNIWPYQYLFQLFPFRGIIEPARFFIIFYFFSTLLILLLLSKIKSKFWLYLILLLLILERVPLSFPSSSDYYDERMVKVVQSSPTKAVFNLPLYVDWWNGQVYDMYSVHFNKPMVNGYVQWSGNIPFSRTLTDKLEKYTCYYEPEYAPTDYSYEDAVNLREQTIKQMREHNIRLVLLHKDLYLNTNHCIRARQYINVFFEDQENWDIIYENSNKKALWLKN